jgi:diguanylate cyclase (GGDEF)-like protein
VESFDWQRRKVTVSVGVSTLQNETANPAVFLESADKALYASKENGRNRVTHYAATHSPQALAG